VHLNETRSEIHLTKTMQKKPVPSVAAGHVNGIHNAALTATRPHETNALLGRAVLLRHPALGRGALPVAGLIVGTYAVDERYVIVQAFPLGKQPVQLADVELRDGDPGVTNEAVVWLVT
jgi:hypothetical protein